MIDTASLVTFILYLIMLMAIGVYFYRTTASLEDYLLGGRGLGRWVTAFSAQASDMSGWLMMGLPGAVYLGGMPAAWIAIGLFIGTALNWRMVAARLRVYTQMTGSLTLASFFEERFGDPSGLLRNITAIITLIFFTIYASSGLVASGKLFESMFHIDYSTAVVLGGAIIITYTFLGGFLAVCYTDLLQGALMVIAIVVVPIVGCYAAGGPAAITSAMTSRGTPAGLLPEGGPGMLAIISAAAWGLGYFGQPHILVRFMGIRSGAEVPGAMAIALVWVAVSLAGAITVGLIGIPLFEGLTGGEEEKVFLLMIDSALAPWARGVMLAAVLSAIMSTIDSQLLVSSSTLTEDFYKKAIRPDATEREMIFVGRASVIAISAIALLLALKPGSTILGLVAYAWAGFGAAFGPVVLAALFSRGTGWRAALAGMVSGTIVLVIWRSLGLGEIIYEIVPGFAANLLTMMIVNRFNPGAAEPVGRLFDEVEKTVSSL
ncbi:MAG TPA: sodium/proline symporter PutP [Spirochaetota bacterium]|nr:MAG: Sodium/proline symporter [Spirochaetes bacterium ADurb.BinA120]HNU92245.1 sodium/proline symporter PutP [Spirochaetota bacterium]HPI13855.1 sodium/proline symporter PutP [Spirochaetota bacterium]HPO45255.1 sodium/proline symporter PutP [Spirochaetota bacterium]HPV96991.1 sodium/proline symporter PutP [Spirochaetota bacterium]